VEIQKQITLHAQALEDEGILDLPTTGADEVVIYNETVEVAFLQALKECYDSHCNCEKDKFQSTVMKPFKKKIVQLFFLAHQNKDYKITSALKKEPAAAAASPTPDKVKVPDVLKVSTTAKKVSIPKRKSSPKKKSPVVKVNMKFQEKLSKLRLKKKRVSNCQNLQTVLPKQQQQNPIPKAQRETC